MRLSGSRCWIFAVALLCGAPSGAVILSTGDGTGNVMAPPDDPGWDNIGTRVNGLTVIYLGNGWVLTANHVGAGDVVLAGKRYAAIPGSEYRVRNPDSTPADLLLFRIDGLPSLSFLPIASAPPSVGSTATLIGAGVNRGAATSWGGAAGYLWGSGSTLRWGAAPVWQVGVYTLVVGSITRSFTTAFGGVVYAAQGAAGDSGGAVFRKSQGTWVLAGVMTAIDGYRGQPAGMALYGNETYAADLSYYRDQILSVVSPRCGLGFELILILPPLLALAKRRARRRR